MKPFIYIAAFVRSGSTLLEEMLTQLPYSYIFHEPRFHGSVRNRQVFINDLSGYLNIDQVKRLKLKNLTQFFKPTGISQIGVKEVRNVDWKYYCGAFPDTKFLLTGRDPRDVYLSLHYYHLRSNAWKPKFPFSPVGVSKEFRGEYIIQCHLAEHHNCMKVKYEDLCMDPDVFQKVKTFVDSSIPNVGEIGALHKQIKRGVYEIQLHQSNLTGRVVDRWKQEKSQKLVEQAHAFAVIMRDYCEFWGYKI